MDLIRTRPWRFRLALALAQTLASATVPAAELGQERIVDLELVLAVDAGPNIIANWEQDSDNAFTVPVGIGINKTFQFGKVPVRIGGQFFYSVIKPDTVGTDWSFRFYVIPAVASALFDWMQ